MKPTPTAIAVAIVADPRLRATCRTVLHREPDITVIAERPPSPEAIAAVTRDRPAIILVDATRLASDLARALSTVEGRSPGTRVLLLSSRRLADSTVLYALKHGAHGYLEPGRLEPSLGPAVRALHRAEPWLSRRLTAPILAALTAARGSSVGGH